MDKEKRAKLLTEIMEADQKNGLYDILGVNKKITMAQQTCNQFEPTTNTSSATICKWCGQEKFLHALKVDYMAQQTALDWYYQQTVIEGKTNYWELLEQAKQMEKQQSKQDYDAVLFDGTRTTTVNITTKRDMEENRSKEIEIVLDEYNYNCSDGCCTHYGIVTTLNGEELPSHNMDTETILRQVLEHLGYSVNITYKYNGEEF